MLYLDALLRVRIFVSLYIFSLRGKSVHLNEIENNSFITFNDEVNNSVLLKMSLPYAQVIQFSSNTIFVEIKQNVAKKTFIVIMFVSEKLL